MRGFLYAQSMAAEQNDCSEEAVVVQLAELAAAGQEAHIAEPQRGARNFAGKPEAERLVQANRERVASGAGKGRQKLRTEKVERSMAHMYTTGGMRRLYLRGRANIRKRLLVHACGHNLGVLMRSLTGVGTPRTLQGQGRQAAANLYFAVYSRLREACRGLLGALRGRLVLRTGKLPGTRRKTRIGRRKTAQQGRRPTSPENH